MSAERYYTDRIAELDLLRGAAITMVLLRHYAVVEGFKQLWIGVDVFFTLSGFLVAGILIREYQTSNGVQVGRFLIRRGLKIYPSFYLFLFFTAGLAFVMKLSGKPIFFPVLNIKKFLVEVFYLQSFQGGLWWHTWSLAVEEHFYFLLALIVFLLVRFRRKRLMFWLTVISMICIPLCIGLRFNAAARFPEFSYIIHYNNTFLRLDSLFFGVLLAVFYYGSGPVWKSWKPQWWPAVVLAGLSGITVWLTFFPLENLKTATWGFTVIYVGFGAILFGLLAWRHHNNWTERPAIEGNPVFRSMLFMGRNSYNIYLWHGLVLESMILFLFSAFDISMFDPMRWDFFLVYFILCILLGRAVTALLEIPILRWRDKRYRGAGKISQA